MAAALKAAVLAGLVCHTSAVRHKDTENLLKDLRELTPYSVMRCAGVQAVQTVSMTCADYDAIENKIRTLYARLDTACTATYCPQADWAGCILRFAGHDFMDYQSGTGGPDGCIDLTDDDNKGLAECLHVGEFGISLADAYADFCTKVSLADFTVIAAEAIMKISRGSGFMVNFKQHFKYGRITSKECAFVAHRLPNPENGCAAVQETFINSMRLTWPESAALMGVHSLGRAEIRHSGYNGWWSSAEGSRRFDNDYYLGLVAKGWMPEKAVGGNPNKNQWRRVDKGDNEAVLGKEMMLNTDMCLVFTPDVPGLVPLLARNTSCCAWSGIFATCKGIHAYNKGDFCGAPAGDCLGLVPTQRADCCGAQFGKDASVDCGDFGTPMGPAWQDVKAFANNETQWLLEFKAAWLKATANGFSTSLRTMDCNVGVPAYFAPKRIVEAKVAKPPKVK